MGEYIAKSLPVQLDALTRTTRVSVDENIITKNAKAYSKLCN
jgi:hypothetical protein